MAAAIRCPQARKSFVAVAVWAAPRGETRETAVRTIVVTRNARAGSRENLAHSSARTVPKSVQTKTAMAKVAAVRCWAE